MKKLRIILVFVLLVGAVFLSACSSNVGGLGKRVSDIKSGSDTLGTPITCRCDNKDDVGGVTCQGSIEGGQAICSCCQEALKTV